MGGVRWSALVLSVGLKLLFPALVSWAGWAVGADEVSWAMKHLPVVSPSAAHVTLRSLSLYPRVWGPPDFTCAALRAT